MKFRKMIGKLLLLFSFFRIGSLQNMVLEEICEPIHTRSSGVEIICCSSWSKLPENCGHSVSPLCRSKCRCDLFVAASELNCIPQSDSAEIVADIPPLWMDHKNVDNELFQCSNPAFPNRNSAEFHLNLDFDLDSAQIQEFLSAFNQSVQLRKLSIELHSKKHPLKLPAISETCPHLEQLIIRGRQKYILNKQLEMIGLDELKHLKSILIERVTNGSFGGLFDSKISVNFSQSLTELSLIEVRSLKTLPKWIETCENLEILTISGSLITEIEMLNKLTSVKRMNLSKNQISGHLEGILQSVNLKSLKLNANSISSVSNDYFKNLINLETLDLSENPIRNLPEYLFRNVGQLKWLYLKRTRLQVLSATHLVGLTNLNVLNLQGCSELYLDVYALISTPRLENLDLRSMNLTVIPAAVTQTERLKHLDLNFNLLHSNYSFPPEIILNLPINLENFHFAENPLMEIPESFYGISISKRPKLLQNILVQLRMTELWWRQSCCESIWIYHLRHYPQIIGNLFTVNETLNPEGTDNMDVIDKHCIDQYQSINNRLSIFNQHSIRLANGRRDFADELELTSRFKKRFAKNNLEKYAWLLPISLIFNVISFFVWLIILAVSVTHQVMRSQKYIVNQKDVNDTNQYDLDQDPTFEELLTDQLNNNHTTQRSNSRKRISVGQHQQLQRQTTLQLQTDDISMGHVSRPSVSSEQEFA